MNETLVAGAAGAVPAPGARPVRPLTFLFVMHYPGYLRYFDSVIRSLADRGHRVCLAFESVEKQKEGLEALRDMPPGVEMLGACAKRKDPFHPVAALVRRTIDCARYLHPRFADAHYLRSRMEAGPLYFFRPLTWIRSLAPARLDRLLKSLLLLERAIPTSPEVDRFIAGIMPDAVVVSPLVTDGSRQVDYVKSARRAGIPCGLGVASWDHLTTKGLVRLQPDMLLVWNQAQKAEAVEYHSVPPSNVVVTGAQNFDKWFTRRPGTTRDAFCEKVGLPPGRPFVMFAGSTASISAPDAEVAFVRRWIGAVRSSPDPAVRDMGILVRPHPYNLGLWDREDLSGLGDVAVWPRNGANPVAESDRAEYFDSLYHCAAVAGVNTSAMIEAAIVGRPVLSVLSPEFGLTQTGTVHFHHLLPENGGFLLVSRGLEEHVRQLGGVIADQGSARTAIRRFVGTFVRPHGLDVECTPRFVEAVEGLAAGRRRGGEGVPATLLPLTFGLWTLGAVPWVWRNFGRKTARTIRKALKV